MVCRGTHFFIDKFICFMVQQGIWRIFYAVSDMVAVYDGVDPY
jgi:hypothetical protein